MPITITLPETIKDHPPLQDDDLSKIESGCAFIKAAINNGDDLSENQMLNAWSILSALPDNQLIADLIRSNSMNHDMFIEDMAKKLLATGSNKPRKCSKISNDFKKCLDCSFRTKNSSPVRIPNSKNIWPNKDNGWWTKDKRPVPDMDWVDWAVDNYKIINSQGKTFLWTGKYFKAMRSKEEVEEFVRVGFSPPIQHTPPRVDVKNNLLLRNHQPSTYFMKECRTKINMNNGVYDMETGVLEPHTDDCARYAFNYILPYDYEENAPCPVFEESLMYWLADDKDLFKFILEFMGTLFEYGKHKKQKVLLLDGDGANGKSTLIFVIKNLLGEENCDSATLTQINDANTRMRIINKHANLSEESGPDIFKRTDQFKNMTGAGDAEIKTLYANKEMAKTFVKFVVACNGVPPTKDLTKGFLRRLGLVNFDVEIPEDEQRDSIKEDLINELPGIFNLCMRHLQVLQSNNYKFSGQNKVALNVDNYRNENDNVKQFIDDECSVDPGNSCKPTELFAKYRSYCHTEGETPVGRQAFFKRIKTYVKGFNPNHNEWNPILKKTERKGVGITWTADCLIENQKRLELTTTN
jgi:P4 family phage/plasmid primase-like protien